MAVERKELIGNKMTTITITRPDDWHVHLRDGAALTNTVADISRYFGRAIVMPNLVPPVTNAELAMQYHQRIMAAKPSAQFQPLMVLYLTDQTTAEDIKAAKASGIVYAAKLYPAGATTNSSSGVTNVDNIASVLAAMEEVNMPKMPLISLKQQVITLQQQLLFIIYYSTVTTCWLAVYAHIFIACQYSSVIFINMHLLKLLQVVVLSFS